MRVAIHSRILLRYLSLLLILLFKSYYSQEIPLATDNPAIPYLERLHTSGSISLPHYGSQPYYFHEVKSLLDTLQELQRLSLAENRLVQKYFDSFNIQALPFGFATPFHQWENYRTNYLYSFSIKKPRLYFLSYRDRNAQVWIDWNEEVRIEKYNKQYRTFYHDRVAIQGYIPNNISFYTDFSLYRLSNNEQIKTLPKEYKNQHLQNYRELNWSIWDETTTSITISNNSSSLTIGKIPIVWGYSTRFSPILSNNVEPFPLITGSINYKKFNLIFLHGFLRADSLQLISDKGRKIAAHRLEFTASRKLKFSFNELVIYNRQYVEWGYVLPINFFWSEEHDLGDRDNMLMALDLDWIPLPGIEIYQTIFWDELAWSKIFSSWWGNKFIFQTGVHWVPSWKSLPADFRVEITISRPWVYTHKEPSNTYTSNGINLGYPLGPNAQTLYLESNLYMSYRLHINNSILFTRQGSGIGSDPSDNYNNRDRTLDNNTPFLLGKVVSSFQWNTELVYELTRFLTIASRLRLQSNAKQNQLFFIIRFQW